jgi:surface protein
MWRSHRLAGFALLLFLPAHVAAVSAITNANIGMAVTAWLTDPTAAATAYGPIADWDTAAVTSMVSLFKNKGTFNGDISKWNVASVTDMYEVRLESVYATYSFSYVSSSLSTHHRTSIR